MMMQSRENNTHIQMQIQIHIELRYICWQVSGKKYINNTNKYALSGQFFTFGFSVLIYFP